MDGDFRFRGFNGHQNRGLRLPVLTRNGSRSDRQKPALGVHKPEVEPGEGERRVPARALS